MSAPLTQWIVSDNSVRFHQSGGYNFSGNTTPKVRPMQTLHARHYATGKPLAITTDAGRIVTMTPSTQNPTAWVAPSFFDVQINGCLGIGFNSPELTVEGVRTVADHCQKHGIGGFCPTLITGGFEALEHGFKTLTKALNTDAELARRIPGHHLEGPYISAQDGPRGAHPGVHARDPNWDEFQRWNDAANGRIRMVTLAPERPGALPFIEKLAGSGIVVALGHTAATGQQIRDAVTAGAKTSTHLGNGCHAMLPRHDNYVWEQLAHDGLWASVIADGHHLPDTILRVVARVKTPKRLLLTCDAGSLAGLSAGRYSQWGTELEVLPSGKIVVPGTPFLAGSGSFTDNCVSTMARLVGLIDAIEMASVRPRELLGLAVSTIEVGQPDDLIVFEWDSTTGLTVL